MQNYNSSNAFHTQLRWFLRKKTMTETTWEVPYSLELLAKCHYHYNFLINFHFNSDLKEPYGVFTEHFITQLAGVIDPFSELLDLRLDSFSIMGTICWTDDEVCKSSGYLNQCWHTEANTGKEKPSPQCGKHAIQ